mgnify:CR=1 FL=1
MIFGPDGRIRQTADRLDRPNNVDVDYGLSGSIDIAVVTERLQKRLPIFRRQRHHGPQRAWRDGQVY